MKGKLASPTSTTLGRNSLVSIDLPRMRNFCFLIYSRHLHVATLRFQIQRCLTMTQASCQKWKPVRLAFDEETSSAAHCQWSERHLRLWKDLWVSTNTQIFFIAPWRNILDLEKKKIAEHIEWLYDFLSGLVFLQYRNETKRSLLPNEITSLDTVKALFVRSFPKQLTMEYLDSPRVKIYIHDSNKDMFYELEDLR